MIIHGSRPGQPGPLYVENQWPDKRVLNLGCGLRPMLGAVNHDRTDRPGPWVDAVWDLDDVTWPSIIMGHTSFDIICAYDVWEHLNKPMAAVRKARNLLAPGGLLVLRVAAWDNPQTWDNFDHKHPVGPAVFDLFDPLTYKGQVYGSWDVCEEGDPLAHMSVQDVQRVLARPDAVPPCPGDWYFELRREE